MLSNNKLDVLLVVLHITIVNIDYGWAHLICAHFLVG